MKSVAGNTVQTDVLYMRRCFQLALCGEQGAPPNPMVGAVIVHEGRIIGEGYHACCGGPHAEVNAVHSVRQSDLPYLPESTLYVSLEPCAHHGKTPPCTSLILEMGIRRVVIGCEDPFPKVQGTGISILREAGVEVSISGLREEARWLNRRFITYHEKVRPYITLKWARSADGYIDRLRCVEAEGSTEPLRLSTPQTQVTVHHLRARHQAILVGSNTWRLDRPQLSVRHWAVLHEPLKVVLGQVPPEELPAGWQAYTSINAMLQSLHAQGIQSLLVEGGTRTLQSFIDAGLWDEAQEEVSSTIVGEDGVPAPGMPRGMVQMQENHWGVTFNRWYSNP